MFLLRPSIGKFVWLSFHESNNRRNVKTSPVWDEIQRFLRLVTLQLLSGVEDQDEKVLLRLRSNIQQFLRNDTTYSVN